jgi:hypothetical protein
LTALQSNAQLPAKSDRKMDLTTVDKQKGSQFCGPFFIFMNAVSAFEFIDPLSHEHHGYPYVQPI